MTSLLRRRTNIMTLIVVALVMAVITPLYGVTTVSASGARQQYFTLDAAAALLQVPVETLKHDDRQNVRAAAALMAHVTQAYSRPVTLS